MLLQYLKMPGGGKGKRSHPAAGKILASPPPIHFGFGAENPGGNTQGAAAPA